MSITKRELDDRIFAAQRDCFSAYLKLLHPLDEESGLAFDLLDGRYSIIEDVINSKDTDFGAQFNEVIRNNDCKLGEEKLEKLWTILEKTNIYRIRDGYDKILNVKGIVTFKSDTTGVKQVTSNELNRRYYEGKLLLTNGVLPGLVLYILHIRDGIFIDKYRTQIIKTEEAIDKFDKLIDAEKNYFRFISNHLWFVNRIFAHHLQKIDQIFYRGIKEVNEYQKKIDRLKRTATANYNDGIQLNIELDKRTNFVQAALDAMQKIVGYCKSTYKLPGIDEMKRNCSPSDVLRYKILFLYECLGWASEVYCKTIEPIYLDFIKEESIKNEKENIRKRFEKVGELAAEIFPAPEKNGSGEYDGNYEKRKAVEKSLKKLEELLNICN